ncbi:MAG: HAD family hydrolase [Syntrophomonadaceae bacterium]
MKLAIFDFDGTLLQKDTLPCLADEWMRQGRSRLRCWSVWAAVLPVVLAYKLKIISRENMKGRAFKGFNRLYTGLSRSEIAGFFRQAYPYIKKHFNPAVLEEIESARRQRFHCVLVSGSYLELLQIIGADLGIDTVLGARLAFSNDIYDPRGDTRFVDGRAKRCMLVEAFRDRDVDWQASRAYGDSLTDIFIMETVGEKIAVRPDPHLLDYAGQNGWRIMA